MLTPAISTGRCLQMPLTKLDSCGLVEEAQPLPNRSPNPASHGVSDLGKIPRKTLQPARERKGRSWDQL